MAFESTAINDLVAGLQRKPLEREEDDWLFGEHDSLFRDDATELDPRMNPSPVAVASQGSAPLQLRHAQGSPQYGAPLAPRQPVVPLPQPFQRMPAPAIDNAFDRSRSPTTYVRSTDWTSIAKKAALPVGLACIVVVLLGVYVAKSKTSEAKSVAMTEPAVETAKVEAAALAAAPAPAAAAAAAESEPAPAPMPVVTPIEEAKVEEPKVEEPKVEEPKVEEPKVEEPKVEAPKVEAPKVEEPKVEEAKVEAPKVEAKAAAPIPEPVNVEPGSPASRFLGAAEPTVPTVPTTTTKPRPAPAPTVVSDMPAPKPAAAPAPAEELGVTVIAKKPKKKSRAELRAERRAAAKRAVKASLAKARTKKRVAVADEAEAEEDEGAAPKKPEKSAPAAKDGKGTLSIASSPSMEVWVDGRNSKAMTPVRVILLAGKHKVTLFDKQNAKARSFDIEIKPGETTKIVKNYD